MKHILQNTIQTNADGSLEFIEYDDITGTATAKKILAIIDADKSTIKAVRQ